MLKRLRRIGYAQSSLIDYRAATHLHCMASAVGYECREDAYDWHGLRRGEAEFGLLQYTLSGSGQLTYEGMTHTVSAGQAMFLQIPHDHRYWLPSGGRWELCYICIVGSEALRLWAEVCAHYGPLADFAANDAVTKAIESVVVDGLRDPRASYRSSTQLYELLMHLLAQRDRQRMGSRLPPNLRQAIELGEARFSEELGVDDLAAEAGLSRYHFSRLFRAHIGMSPGAWLQKQRIGHAAELLTTTRQPLADIAHVCGFKDANYFGKVFRRAYGVSPGVFRRSGMYG